MNRRSSQSHSKGPHAKGASQRQLRVGEVLRHSLSDILRQTDIRDPDLSGVSVTVTEVKPSPDMRHATVFVEPLGGRNADAIIAGLNRHRGFLRGELGRTITLKFTPELRFVEDTSFAEAERIAKILHSERVARDLQAEAEVDQKIMAGKSTGEDDDGPQT